MKNVEIKPSFNENRSILGEKLPLNTPYTILVDVSDRCNFKCEYCFRAEGSTVEAQDYRKNVIMSWETFERVVWQLQEFPENLKRISFSHNGEPLCNPKLPEMIRYIKKLGIKGSCEIHTNGVLLTKEISDALIEAGIDRMIISLQGMTEERYQKISKVKVDLEKFYENISYFYNKKKHTVLNIKIVDTSLEAGEDVDFYEKYGMIADRVYIEHVVPLWEKIEKKGTGLYNKYGEIHQWQQCCPIAFYTIGVLPSGIIYPCSHIAPPFDMGTVYSTTLVEAWNSLKRKGFLTDMLRYGRESCPACAGCYIPQNSVFIEEDCIDGYRDDILKRI
ncbi:MAG: radical SAM protein [Acetivibrio ethanolgignens]